MAPAIGYSESIVRRYGVKHGSAGFLKLRRGREG